MVGVAGGQGAHVIDVDRKTMAALERELESHVRAVAESRGISHREAAAAVLADMRARRERPQAANAEVPSE